MRKNRTLAIWTICLNACILISAGHGIAPIAMIEILSWMRLFAGEIFRSGDISFAFTAPYEKTLSVAALFSSIGQALIIWSMLRGRQHQKFWIYLFALFLMWLGVGYLIHSFPDEISGFELLVSLPFLACSSILTYRIIVDWRVERADLNTQETQADSL